MATMNDGILCWSYTGVRNKTYCRILWIVWLCLMLLLFACTGITTAVITLPDEMKQILTWITLCVGGVVTAIFALIWLWERFVPKKYSYSANEKELTVAYGRYRHFPFDQVRSLERQRERNAILLKTSSFSLEVFAADDDYEEVWAFLAGHLTNHCLA